MQMFKEICLTAVIGVLSSSILLADDADAPDKKVPAEIKHCHDGDTCRIVTESGLWFNARLAGIDAPEVSRYGKSKSSGQPMGEESRDALVNLVVKKKGVSIRQVDLDPYNRPVIEIYSGEELINLKLLELGVAERYKGKTKRLDRDKYDAAEQKAKTAKVGIWGLKDYKSPQAWRHEATK